MTATSSRPQTPYRVGLLGCGRVSACHFDAIKHWAKDLALVAVCDNSLDKAQQWAESHGAVDAQGENACHAFDNYEVMLTQAKLDLVVICTPSGQHAEQAVLAAQHGAHVVCEKPMATNLADAQRMMQACEEAGTRLFVVMQNRYNPTLQLLKQAIDAQRFGAIHLVQINVFWHRHQSYYDQAAWRGTYVGDGGALMNQASHYVDLLHWLFSEQLGAVNQVQSMSATLARDIEAEDTCILNVSWEKGALGSVAVTTLTYPEDLEGSITILGERGTVRLAGKALNRFTQWQFDATHSTDELVEQTNYETDSVYGFGHTQYYETVVSRLREQQFVDQDDFLFAYNALEVICSVYKQGKSF